jgi:hypothetical protein
MTDQSIEDASRREFEVYLATHPDFEGEFLERTVDGKYIVKIIEAHWETWKAARQSSQSEPVATLSINIHDEYSLTLNAFEDGEDDGENYARLIAMLGKGHHKLYAAPQQAIPSGWKSLSDGQWMNIVNHDRAWESYSKEEAVHEAVKMTEAKCKENNASPAAPIESDK